MHDERRISRRLRSVRRRSTAAARSLMQKMSPQRGRPHSVESSLSPHSAAVDGAGAAGDALKDGARGGGAGAFDGSSGAGAGGAGGDGGSSEVATFAPEKSRAEDHVKSPWTPQMRVDDALSFKAHVSPIVSLAGTEGSSRLLVTGSFDSTVRWVVCPVLFCFVLFCFVLFCCAVSSVASSVLFSTRALYSRRAA